MKSKLRLLSALLPLALMDSNGFGRLDNNSKLAMVDIDFTQKEPPIPKGCKEYWFNINGGFSTEKMRRDEIVFKCIASNDKVAKKKFEKWSSKQ